MKNLQHTIPAIAPIVKTQTGVILCDAPDPAADRARLIAAAARRYKLTHADIEAALGTPFTPTKSHAHRDSRGRLWFTARIDGHHVQFSLNRADNLDNVGCLTCTPHRHDSKLTVCPAAAAVAVHYVARQLGLSLDTPTDEALAPAHPADLIAADLAAEYAALGQPFLDRLHRAVDLVKAGQTEFPKYDTRWEPYGFYGLRLCGCPDAQHRNVSADRIGVCCKHTLAQLIKSRIDGDIQRAGYRKAADAWQRSAGRCEVCGKPATGIDGLCDSCYNGTAEPEPEKPWYLRPDPINRSAAGAGRAQFVGHRYGRD